MKYLKETAGSSRRGAGGVLAGRRDAGQQGRDKGARPTLYPGRVHPGVQGAGGGRVWRGATGRLDRRGRDEASSGGEMSQVSMFNISVYMLCVVQLNQILYLH